MRWPEKWSHHKSLRASERRFWTNILNAPRRFGQISLPFEFCSHEIWASDYLFCFSFIGTNSKLVPIYKNNNTLEGLEIKVIAQYKRYKAKKNKKTKILFPDSCSCFYVRLPSAMCGRRVWQSCQVVSDRSSLFRSFSLSSDSNLLLSTFSTR